MIAPRRSPPTPRNAGARSPPPLGGALGVSCGLTILVRAARASHHARATPYGSGGSSECEWWERGDDPVRGMIAPRRAPPTPRNAGARSPPPLGGALGVSCGLTILVRAARASHNARATPYGSGGSSECEWW